MPSKRNIFLIPFVTIFVLIGVMGGFFWGESKKMDPQIYLANTVGSQILEVNKLYERLIVYDALVNKEMIEYNKDMFTVIDCGELLRSIKGMKNYPELKYFKEGLDYGWKAISNNGLDEKNLVLCRGDLLEWLN